MKKVLLIILGIALTYGVNAQLRYGIKLGGTLSNLSTKTAGESDNSDPKIGIQAGGILEYSFSPSFSLQPELLYVNNGGKFENDLSFNMHNLQLPVNIKYKMGTDNLKFYVTAGPYLGYIFAARLKTGSVSVNAFDESVNNEMKLKHFDFGLGTGLGIEIAERYIVGVGYKYGLANLTKVEDVTVKSGTFNLSIGYLF
ncbi:MAG: PorT family protein [Prevotellaceae bacterium]|jgi:opacity protein-like surface antigen|nr:PorT family protein [Prevotellaceae bacterium]